MLCNSNHILVRRADKTQIYLVSAAGGSLAVNDTFRPLYLPSSGCTLSCYKVTIQYTVCLLLMMMTMSFKKL